MTYRTRAAKLRNPNAKIKITSTVNDWLKARAFYRERLWTLRNGIMTTVINGFRMSEREFKKRYPVPQVNNFWQNLDNPNGRVLK